MCFVVGDACIPQIGGLLKEVFSLKVGRYTRDVHTSKKSVPQRFGILVRCVPQSACSLNLKDV